MNTYTVLIKFVSFLDSVTYNLEIPEALMLQCVIITLFIKDSASQTWPKREVNGTGNVYGR